MDRTGSERMKRAKLEESCKINRGAVLKSTVDESARMEGRRKGKGDKQRNVRTQ